MAASQTLTAQKRTVLGTQTSRQLRGAGRIPSNIQGGGDHVDISIDEHEFMASRRAHTHLYDIDVEGSVETAVVNELQWDTFGDNIIHVEFRKVERGVEGQNEVQLVFVGQPKGGVANHAIEQLLIRCIPSLIPDNIEINVDGLEEHSHVKAKDLKLPAGVQLAGDPEQDVATIIGAAGSPAAKSDDDDEEEGAEA
jgi:large subunit ribosomal protein L25